jgi:glycosyltransferase involved in cell wall biosynthesis
VSAFKEFKKNFATKLTMSNSRRIDYSLKQAFKERGDWPRITVVTPSYNQGMFLEATVQSILLQGYPNLEYIVIDGGSEDDSVQVIKKYERGIAYWHSRKDYGQADAINQGMRLATGDILCWLNADDLYLPGTLLEVARQFKEVIGKTHLLYGSALTMREDGENLDGGSRVAAAFNPSVLTYCDYVVQPSSFWTRELWLETGELNVNYHYAFDWEWFIRASKRVQFQHFHRFFSIYRLHSSQKTGTGGSARMHEINEIIERFASDYWKRLYRIAFQRHQRIVRTRSFLMRMRIPGVSLLLPLCFPRILQEAGISSRRHLMIILYMLGLNSA